MRQNGRGLKASRQSPRPWGGTFTGHKELGGLWVPAQSEVYWELPEGRFVYWRGEVTGLELA